MDKQPVEPPISAAFGRNTARARKRLGLSQRALSVTSGIPSQRLSMIERGVANVTLATAERLASALNTTVARLLSER